MLVLSAGLVSRARSRDVEDLLNLFLQRITSRLNKCLTVRVVPSKAGSGSDSLVVTERSLRSDPYACDWDPNGRQKVYV
jgi:hypothetical protein